MNDLAKRLRGHAESLDNKAGCLPWPDLYRDAADEIERLREALRAAKDRAVDRQDFEGAARIRDAIDGEATPA